MHKFQVGQLVRAPLKEEFSRWVISNHDLHEIPRAGVYTVVGITSAEHYLLNDGGGSWHYTWLEPYDDFEEWVREVRAHAHR